MSKLNDCFINLSITLRNLRGQDLSSSEHVIISEIESNITQQICNANNLLNDIHYHFKDAIKSELEKLRANHDK